MISSAWRNQENLLKGELGLHQVGSGDRVLRKSNNTLKGLEREYPEKRLALTLSKTKTRGLLFKYLNKKLICCFFFFIPFYTLLLEGLVSTILRLNLIPYKILV